jgi:hypothetical protein
VRYLVPTRTLQGSAVTLVDLTVNRDSKTPHPAIKQYGVAYKGYDKLAAENTVISNSREKQGQTPLRDPFAKAAAFEAESQWKLIILWWTHWGAYPENSSQEVISPRWRKEEQRVKEVKKEEDQDAMVPITGNQELRRIVARA